MNKLKQFRDKHGLTQDQLAKMLGKSKNHISKIERGVVELVPTIELLLNELDKKMTPTD